MRMIIPAFAAALAVSGCKTSGVKAWTPLDSIRGGALVQSSVESALGSGHRLLSVELLFDDSAGRSLSLDVTPGELDKHGGLALVSLPPGSYSLRVRLGVAVGGIPMIRTLDPRALRDAGPFVVESGKVVPIGRLSAVIRPPQTADMGSSTFDLDSSPQARRSLLQEALGRAEAQGGQWSEPLEAALTRY